MESPGSLLNSIVPDSPALFLLVLPLLALLLWQTLHRMKRGAYSLTGLEFLRRHQSLGGRWRKALRALAWSLVVVLLGLLWTDPVVFTKGALFGEGGSTLNRNFIVAFDMSPSMNLPVTHKGFGGEDLKAGDEGVSRYETARSALFEFLQRFEGDRFGLILFSTEPFLARWPTTETGNRFLEILGDNIRRGSGTQLERFSSLTNIDKALALGREVFGGEEGAIIMISDTEDDIENMGAAVQDLRDHHIRLYTIGVGVADEIIDKLSAQFAHDPGFRIFQVDSEQDMREAYRLVGEVEESDLFARTEARYRTSLRWLLALLLTVVTLLILWFDQSAFHQSSTLYTAIQGSGRERHGL